MTFDDLQDLINEAAADPARTRVLVTTPDNFYEVQAEIDCDGDLVLSLGAKVKS